MPNSFLLTSLSLTGCLGFIAKLSSRVVLEVVLSKPFSSIHVTWSYSPSSTLSYQHTSAPIGMLPSRTQGFHPYILNAFQNATGGCVQPNRLREGWQEAADIRHS